MPSKTIGDVTLGELTARVFPETAIPAPALEAGFVVQTFGREGLLYGQNAFDYNLLTVNPVPGQCVPQADGSIFLPGLSGDNFASTLATARRASNAAGFQGTAFGGGGYFESTISFFPAVVPPGGKLPFPCYYANDLFFCLGKPVKYARDQRAEWDLMQYVKNSLLYITLAALIDWSHTGKAGEGPNGTATINPQNAMIALGDIDVTKPNRYAGRWQMATDTSPGFIDGYINEISLLPLVNGKRIQWDKFNPLSTDAPVIGKNAGAVIDASYMVPTWGTSPDCPMTVHGARFFQRSGANNLYSP